MESEPQPGARERSPRLASVSTGSLLVALPRAAFAGGILGGASAEGLSRAGVLLAVGSGAIVLALFAGSSSKRRVLLDKLPAPPAGAVVGPWWQSLVRAALPSTVGLGILGAAALAFSRGLAGLCGGLLVGLAILGLAFGILLLVEERRTGRRLYVDWGILQPRRYASPEVG